jgi:hypothetical protein
MMLSVYAVSPVWDSAEEMKKNPVQARRLDTVPSSDTKAAGVAGPQIFGPGRRFDLETTARHGNDS